MSNKRQRRNAKLRLIAFKKNEQFKNLYGVDIHKDIYKNNTKKFIQDNAKIEEINYNDIDYKAWSKWSFNRYMSMNAHSKAYVCSNIKRMTKEDIAYMDMLGGSLYQWENPNTMGISAGTTQRIKKYKETYFESC